MYVYILCNVENRMELCNILDFISLAVDILPTTETLNFSDKENNKYV
jgi:hypothetical protein